MAEQQITDSLDCSSDALGRQPKRSFATRFGPKGRTANTGTPLMETEIVDQLDLSDEPLGETPIRYMGPARPDDRIEAVVSRIVSHLPGGSLLHSIWRARPGQE